MQIVSLDVLKKLAAGKGQLEEADGSFSYEDFKKYYAQTRRKIDDLWMNTAKKNGRTKIEFAYDFVRQNWLKNHCPPIRFIDEGSSRAAYACNGGKCLKVAINEKGIAQNQTEFENTGAENADYSCFVQAYDCDHQTWGSIVVECCSEFNEAVANKLYVCEDFLYVFVVFFVQILIEHDFYMKSALADLQYRISDKDEENEWREGRGEFSHSVQVQLEGMRAAERWMQELEAKSQKPQFKVLQDVVDFYIDHGRTDDKMKLADLAIPRNWGLAIRDSTIVPVIIDAGFSQDVEDNYYSD